MNIREKEAFVASVLANPTKFDWGMSDYGFLHCGIERGLELQIYRDYLRNPDTARLYSLPYDCVVSLINGMCEVAPYEFDCKGHLYLRRDRFDQKPHPVHISTGLQVNYSPGKEFLVRHSKIYRTDFADGSVVLNEIGDNIGYAAWFCNAGERMPNLDIPSEHTVTRVCNMALNKSSLRRRA